MSEKTHLASTFKLKEAARHGKAYKSQLVNVTLLILLVTLTMSLFYSFAWVRIGLLLSWYMRYAKQDSSAAIYELSLGGVLVFLGTMGVCAVLVLCFQLYFPRRAPKLDNIVPTFSRLNPNQYLANIKNNLAYNSFGFVLVLLILALTFYQALTEYSVFKQILASFDISSCFKFLVNLFYISLSALVILALLDLLRRRKIFLKDLRMSHQELRNEQKDQEGDTLIKSIRRFEQQQSIYQAIEKKISKNSILIVGGK